MLDEDGNRRDNDERATFLKELPVIDEDGNRRDKSDAIGEADHGEASRVPLGLDGVNHAMGKDGKLAIEDLEGYISAVQVNKTGFCEGRANMITVSNTCGVSQDNIEGYLDALSGAGPRKDPFEGGFLRH